MGFIRDTTRHNEANTPGNMIQCMKDSIWDRFNPSTDRTHSNIGQRTSENFITLTTCEEGAGPVNPATAQATCSSSLYSFSLRTPTAAVSKSCKMQNIQYKNRCKCPSPAHIPLTAQTMVSRSIAMPVISTRPHSSSRRPLAFKTANYNTVQDLRRDQANVMGSATFDVIFFSAANTTPSFVKTPRAAPAFETASIAYST